MNEPIEHDRLIAFLDIVGFEKNYDSKKHILLELLKTIRQCESNFCAEYKDNGYPGSKRICITPSCIGFSDSIIITIPLKLKGDEYLSHERIDLTIPIVMLSIIDLVVKLYILTLARGFLLRGAIAYGDVFYDKENRIITGLPLMEAIKDEGKIAIYPRIIVSHSILKIYREYASSHLNSDGVSLFSRRDFDGLYYIDWLQSLMKPPLDNEKEKAIVSIFRSMKEQIRINIIGLESDESNKLEYLAKWYWLANYFDISANNSQIAELNNELFDLHKYNEENVMEKIHSILNLNHKTP